MLSIIQKMISSYFHHFSPFAIKKNCHLSVRAAGKHTQWGTASNFHPGILKNFRIPWTLFWITTIKWSSWGTTVTTLRLNSLNPTKALQSSLKGSAQELFEAQVTLSCLCLIDGRRPLSAIYVYWSSNKAPSAALVPLSMVPMSYWVLKLIRKYVSPSFVSSSTRTSFLAHLSVSVKIFLKESFVQSTGGKIPQRDPAQIYLLLPPFYLSLDLDLESFFSLT